MKTRNDSYMVQYRHVNFLLFGGEYMTQYRVYTSTWIRNKTSLHDPRDTNGLLNHFEILTFCGLQLAVSFFYGFRQKHVHCSFILFTRERVCS